MTLFIPSEISRFYHSHMQHNCDSYLGYTYDRYGLVFFPCSMLLFYLLFIINLIFACISIAPFILLSYSKYKEQQKKLPVICI